MSCIFFRGLEDHMELDTSQKILSLHSTGVPQHWRNPLVNLQLSQGIIENSFNWCVQIISWQRNDIQMYSCSHFEEYFVSLFCILSFLLMPLLTSELQLTCNYQGNFGNSWNYNYSTHLLCVSFLLCSIRKSRQNRIKSWINVEANVYCFWFSCLIRTYLLSWHRTKQRLSSNLLFI